MENKSIAVPVAIVIAGALIAVSLYYSNGKAPATAVAPTQNSQVATAKVGIGQVTAADHIIGNPDAAVVLVEYSDTECPFCKAFHVTLHKLMENYGQKGTVAWVYRHFPLWKPDSSGRALHSRAGKEAEATECVNKLGGADKFWQYLDKIYSVTPSNNGLDPAQLPILAKSFGIDEKAFNTCLSSGEYAAKVDVTYNEALASGGNGTPFSVFIAKKPFTQKDAGAFVQSLVKKYQVPADLFIISTDNNKIAVSGALPYEIIEDMVKFLAGIK